MRALQIPLDLKGLRFHLEIPRCAGNKITFSPKKRQGRSQLHHAGDFSGADQGTDVGLKWVCGGSNPLRCPPHYIFQCLQIFRGFFTLKIIEIKPFPSSEPRSQPLHPSLNPFDAQSIARLQGGTRQRPRPDSGRSGNGTGLDLKLLPGGAAFQKSILNSPALRQFVVWGFFF